MIGIDEAYRLLLVDGYYDHVRADSALAPIFDKVMDCNWDHHLSRMKEFLGSVALNAGAYSGSPMVKHRNLMTQTPPPSRQHCEKWLSLSRKTREVTAPSPIVVDFFMERAELHCSKPVTRDVWYARY